MEKQLKHKPLSASRIDLLESCSWKYWVKYHLKLPDPSNDGASRGTVVHLVLELLMNPRHKKHFDAILKAQSINASPAMKRLVIKHMKKLNICTKEDGKLVNGMILVGLDLDFYCKGGKLLDPEFEFALDFEEPSFSVKGFIDKLAIYPDEKLIKIIDYKSSKQRFTGDKKNANVQAMIYCLVLRKLYPGYTPSVEFQFLRFPDNPLLKCSFTEDQLDGYQYSLGETQRTVDLFDEKRAHKNFASDGNKRWLCGAGATWVCPYKSGFKYFQLVDNEGKVISTSKEKETLKPKENQKVLEAEYEGCPKFKNEL